MKIYPNKKPAYYSFEREKPATIAPPSIMKYTQEKIIYSNSLRSNE
jgi:hypothetical protein